MHCGLQYIHMAAIILSSRLIIIHAPLWACDDDKTGIARNFVQAYRVAQEKWNIHTYLLIVVLLV